MENAIFWLDDNPEMMKKIPPLAERVESVFFPYRCFTTFRCIFFIIGMMPSILFHDRKYVGVPFIDMGIKGKIFSDVLIIFVVLVLLFLTRKEKGRVDIYPEMMVFYGYDITRKEARPCLFIYWKDIVQYHFEDSYIWLHSTENDPEKMWVKILSIKHYFKQYAPHAKEVRFNMRRYFDEKREQEKADREVAELLAEKEAEEAKEKEKELK